MALADVSDLGGCRGLRPQGARSREPGRVAVVEGATERFSARRTRGREPMLGKFTRLFQTARARSRVGRWRHGQRAVDRRQAEGCARSRRYKVRRPASALHRPRPDVRQRPTLHQVVGCGPCPRRRGDDRLRHERRAAPTAERLSPAARRARLVLDLLA